MPPVKTESQIEMVCANKKCRLELRFRPDEGQLYICGFCAELINQVTQARPLLRKELGREPTRSQIAEALHVDLKEITAALSAQKNAPRQ